MYANAIVIRMDEKLHAGIFSDKRFIFSFFTLSSCGKEKALNVCIINKLNDYLNKRFDLKLDMIRT